MVVAAVVEREVELSVLARVVQELLLVLLGLVQVVVHHEWQV